MNKNVKFLKSFSKKKGILMGIFSLLLILILGACGAGWDVAVKEGVIVDKYLRREISVINDFTGEVEYTYKGMGYIQMKNDGACINVTIMDKKSHQKIDILGSGVHIISKTIEDE